MKKAYTNRIVIFAVALVALVVLVGLGVWYFFLKQPKNISPAIPVANTTPATATSTEQIPAVPALPLFNYIEITDGCGPYYDTGLCVNMRSGPGTNYSVVERLRTGVVLKVASTTVQDKDGLAWYKIIQDKTIRYPERVKSDLFVAVNPSSVAPLEDIGDQDTTRDTPTTTKRIVVDTAEEMLYAYDGDILFMEEPISTGLEFTPTPIGTFKIFRKTPSRYMQGPLPGVSSQYFDLPGVPWNLYFSNGGAVIHGTYWHDHFGKPWSHGCVNLAPENAKKLYVWADLETTITVN